MEPAHAVRKHGLPIDIARLQLRGCFIRAVIENHRSTHAIAAIAINRGYVGPGNAIVLEVLIERMHAHGTHPFGNQITDRIIHHRTHHAGLHPETIRQIGRYIKLAAAHMNLAFGRFAERDDARVQAMDQRA